MSKHVRACSALAIVAVAYTGSLNAPRGVAVELDGDLVVAHMDNRRVVTVRGALPGQWAIWLPLIAQGWPVD